MVRGLLILSLIVESVVCFSQSTEGITGIPDTSYANWSAFQKEIKYHPNISLVQKKILYGVRESENITYCQTGERVLKLDIFRPAKNLKNKRTAIVMVHGGGWRTGNRLQHQPLAQRLAALGYTVITPEYRLSTEALYPAAVYDVKSAVKWIRAHTRNYNIDIDKIVIAGFSAGGQLAALVGNTNGWKEFDQNNCNEGISSSVNAIIDLDGTLSFVHPESGEGDDSKKKSAATLWFGYSKAENPQLWKQASPLTYAGKNSVPTLFINSSVDRMHAGRDDYMKILAAYGIYTEMHTFENSPHSFVLFDPWFSPTVSYIDNFLKKIFKLK